jgi:hypothetical protein
MMLALFAVVDAESAYTGAGAAAKIIAAITARLNRIWGKRVFDMATILLVSLTPF